MSVKFNAKSSKSAPPNEVDEEQFAVDEEQAHALTSRFGSDILGFYMVLEGGFV